MDKSIPPNVSGFNREPRETSQELPILIKASDLPLSMDDRHRDAMFEAYLEIVSGETTALIKLLRSEHAYIGPLLREILASLLEDPNPFGKTLDFRKNKGMERTEQAAMDRLKKQDKEYKAYKVFCKYRLMNNTYEKSLQLAAEQGSFGGERTIERAVQRVRERIKGHLLNSKMDEHSRTLLQGYIL